MERIKLDYFKLPVYFILLFFLLEVLLFTAFHITDTVLYIISAVLFVAAFILMHLAGRTNSISKEIYLSVSAGLFVYYAVFAIPVFTGAISLTRVAFLFLIFFVLFVLAEKGSFRNTLVNITTASMLFFEMLFTGSHSDAYFAVLLTVSLGVCAFLGWVFANSKPTKFESRAILQIVFSFSSVVLLWSVFSLMR